MTVSEKLKLYFQSDLFRMILILGLAFFLVFIPHLNTAYPVHFDEWNHIGFTNQVIEEQTLSVTSNPFTHNVPNWNQMFEIGYYTFLADLHLISGIDWFIIARFLPAFLFLLTVLTCYGIGKKLGFGWQAALFTSLMPTTVGILGPGFMTPVGLGLFFISLSLYLVLSVRGWRLYLLLALIMLFLMAMHAVTAIGLYLIILPFVLLNLKKNIKHSILLFLAISLPFAAAFIAIPGIWKTMIVPGFSNLFETKDAQEAIAIPNLIGIYGSMSAVMCLTGVLVLAWKRGTGNLGLVGGLLALLIILVLYNMFGFGVPIIYYRGIQYAMLLMSIISGAGLKAVSSIRITESGIRNWFDLKQSGILARIVRYLDRNRLARHAGWALAAIVVLTVIVTVVPSRSNEPYYEMIDKTDYQAFTWIRDNLDESYAKAMVDPWKATPFTVITGKPTYSRIFETATQRDNQIYNFLEHGSYDSELLRNAKISIVYTRVFLGNRGSESFPPDNQDLTEVADNIFVFEEAVQPSP